MDLSSLSDHAPGWGEPLRQVLRDLDTAIQSRFPSSTLLAGTQAAGSAALDIKSSGTTGSFNLVRTQDDASHIGHMISVSHYATTSSSYAVDIANYPGAARALVIHQYSGAAQAVVIDNTDANAAVMIRNTENTVRNPGRTGTGDFIRFVRFGDPDLINLSLTADFVLLNSTTQPLVYKSTVAASGFNIVHEGPSGVALSVSQPTSAAYSAGFIGGGGVNIDAATDGTARVLRVRNTGTGQIAQFWNSLGQRSQINNAGEFEHSVGAAGIVLRSPDGTRYRVGVANGGTVVVSAA